MSFPAINNLGTALSELQINFGVLQTDTKNSATGHKNAAILLRGRLFLRLRDCTATKYHVPGFRSNFEFMLPDAKIILVTVKFDLYQDY